MDEVINYVCAMHHGLARLPELPVSACCLIREIHAELMRGVRGGRLQPGELRTSQNWIGPAGCTLNTATFVAPPHHAVSAVLADRENFLHARDDLPPLVNIALTHVQFETIQTFPDRITRVGRRLWPESFAYGATPTACEQTGGRSTNRSGCKKTSTGSARNQLSYEPPSEFTDSRG
jgi:Fic family protein